MQNAEPKRKPLILITLLAVLALSYAGKLFYQNNALSNDVRELTETKEKLNFLLSLERPAPLTSTVHKTIEALDEHMYRIRDDQKEKKFSRCMMQAITEMTGSIGIYVDLNMCGEHINNKATLNIFKELEALDVAPECKSEAIETQFEFKSCRNANEDYLAKTNAMDRLLKLITSHSLWEMHLISRGEYGKY